MNRKAVFWRWVRFLIALGCGAVIASSFSWGWRVVSLIIFSWMINLDADERLREKQKLIDELESQLLEERQPRWPPSQAS